MKHNVFKGTKRTPKRDSEMQAYLSHLYRQLLTADYLIQEHFHKKVKDLYNVQPESFWHKISYFRSIQDEMKEFCNTMSGNVLFKKISRNATKSAKIEALWIGLQESIHFGATDWNEAFEVTCEDCMFMHLTSFDYAVAFGMHQFSNECTKKASVSHIRLPVWQRLRVKTTP